MNELIRIIVLSVFALLISLPFYFISRFIVYTKSKSINKKREFALFILYLALVIFLFNTLIPIDYADGSFSIMNFHLPDKNQIILNPLMLFDLIYNRSIKEHYFEFLFSNFFGNILFFIPVGALLPYLCKFDFKKVVIFGFSVSLFVELCQLFFDRTSDISDLILNVSGTVIGYLIYKKIKNR